LVTGVAFLIASVSTDMMSVMGWGIVAVLVMSLPAFSVLVPGLTTGWVKVIPTYYLVDGVYRVINYGAGWADMSQNLLALLLLSVLFLALGIVVLKRRFQ
jgi:ABC-2 type transport system permease protein